MPSSPAFVLDPSGYTPAGKPRVGTMTPFDDVWKKAKPGDQILVRSGKYRRLQLQKSPRTAGSQPIAFLAEFPGQVFIDRDVTVGSTDSILLKSGQGDVYFDGFDVTADDRAGIKTEGPAGAKAVSFADCKIHGLGDAYDPAWRYDCKWLAHHYLTAKWSEVGSKYWSCWDEHARYLHNIQGNHAFSDTTVKHTGRTALQIVNRMKETTTPMPEGKGNVTIARELVIDVCLGQGGGGSAYTFRGGMPNSTISLENCTVQLGCDPRLAAPFNQNITGCLVVDSGGESKPGAGDMAHPGGTKEVRVKGCSFEVGKVFPGVGGARRPNVRVAECGLFILEDSQIIQHPGAHTIAIEVWDSCREFKAVGTNDVLGQVMYKKVLFQTWALFQAAHPECFA